MFFIIFLESFFTSTKTTSFLSIRKSIMKKIQIKGTLHFRNNIALNDSLDPPEFRVYNKNSKFDTFMLKNPQIFLPKKRLFLKDLYTSETTLP